jgi:hypothetical protein
VLEVKCSADYTVIKNLFTEYSQIKGAEGCFVSFDRELVDLEGFYKRMGFEEIGCDDGIVSMRIDLLKLEA